MGRRRGLRSTALLLGALAAAFAPAPAAAKPEKIVRQHLDAGRVQFSGMDINGDEIADSIRLDRIKGALFYFAGDPRGNFRSFDPATLPEEDRRFVPDVLLEADLDGDEIGDLIMYNRAYLEKYAAVESALLRILAAGVFIGQQKATYQPLSAAALTAEARDAVLGKARKLVLPAP